MHARRPVLAVIGAVVIGVTSAGPAGACAGLVAPGGKVRLLRTATLAAYVDGIEHYVTSFQFSGGGAEFGSIVPLPGIPTKVEKAGEWTLQRLQREVAEGQPGSSDVAGTKLASSSGEAEELYNTRIDALDLTVLRGGGNAVGVWAKEHGFKLTPDAPEVLDFYAERSQIFLAARFNVKAAKEGNDEVGDGTPIHLVIPTTNPWVPLRILGLGRPGTEVIEADVFLLTPRRPALLPVRAPGLEVRRREQASQSLLDDLRSDKNSTWVPKSAWLTYIRIDSAARDLRFDLATDVSGNGEPSWRMAGLKDPRPAPAASVAPAPAASSAAADPGPSEDLTESGPAIVAVPPAPDDDRSPVPFTIAIALVAASGLGLSEQVRRGRARRQP